MRLTRRAGPEITTTTSVVHTGTRISMVRVHTPFYSVQRCPHAMHVTNIVVASSADRVCSS
jgi:hypothetical protein